MAGHPLVPVQRSSPKRRARSRKGEATRRRRERAGARISDSGGSVMASRWKGGEAAGGFGGSLVPSAIPV